ncbi:type I secretion system permease/ATPase [Neorhizobium galegae]|uniref:type I secretion system permease/ATPase n=1 Tax=Neorhizobium galegae TaxID=399 RepID=UPI000622B234|nr:type I secretion system permease/ATPase [Neorhizobium galegae]CDZ56243.1 Toxin secretion ATP-binding protein [Neorhizobium galegae bv. orientalis]KAB1123866.1 type I secretion system permease/ATPase [Neorhizobium galegae]MCQ1806808.1 type I secretion system permease/ATPase [Neorhizobium galegae]CDZ58481.1 Toxin secretion ATP-binding protein [Neorhizobium galegae bv. orientalis]CDZ70041.1 Toxin secretion ATP-binding protein [Neorhizobium galegae bv. orientalis]
MLNVKLDHADTTPFRTFKTAFRSVASFYGRPTSDIVLFSGLPDEISESLELDDVEHLAQRIGLEVIRHGERECREGNFDCPAIIVFENGGVLPLLETDADGNYVTDLVPASGNPVKLTRQELVALKPSFGFAFTLYYQNASDNASVGAAGEIERRHWLLRALVPYWRTYMRVIMAALFINLIALGSPLFTMNVYDRVLPNKAFPTLWVLAIGITLAYTFDFLLKTARAALIDHAGRNADLRLSQMIFDKVLNSTLASRPLSTGEYANRVTQYEFVREFFTSNTVGLLIDTAFVFIFLIVIYMLSGWLVVIPAVALVLSVLIGLHAQAKIGHRMAAATNEASRRQALLVETISTIETVKSLRAEAGMLRRWQELMKLSSRTSEEIKHVSSNAVNLTNLVQQMVSVLIVIAGTYEFSEGHLAMGAIIATVMLAGRAGAPLGQIAMALARFRQAMTSLKILDKIMEQPEDRPSTVGFVNREIKRGGFSFQNVSFQYPGSDYKVINQLSLTVAPGERVGIIGRIGSGKTTLGRLLDGLFLPSDGRLLIDGVDIRQYHMSEVRSAVAVAGQSSDLFSGTVKENLLIGRADATDEELLHVSRMTGVDEFVSNHPRGFDMPVGERGSNLSSGQKQALAIARLLLTKPKIVFLDEPSGAMDLASERHLLAKLSTAFSRETTLLIATHRFSMLELCDRLVVIDKGRIVADGPKAAVLEAMQRKGAKP